MNIKGPFLVKSFVTIGSFDYDWEQSQKPNLTWEVKMLIYFFIFVFFFFESLFFVLIYQCAFWFLKFGLLFFRYM
jgi:hypothetical protein